MKRQDSIKLVLRVRALICNRSGGVRHTAQTVAQRRAYLNPLNSGPQPPARVSGPWPGPRHPNLGVTQFATKERDGHAVFR